MIKLAYPTPAFKIKTEEKKEFIFDPLRKKWLLLTPEEWVRQNFIQYLVQVKLYPTTLIAQEKELRLGEMKKRFDILVYDANHQPWMMVECKAANIRIDSKVLDQVLRYNISVPVSYIIITNGSMTYGWHRANGRFDLLQELPDCE